MATPKSEAFLKHSVLLACRFAASFGLLDMLTNDNESRVFVSLTMDEGKPQASRCINLEAHCHHPGILHSVCRRKALSSLWHAAVVLLPQTCDIAKAVDRTFRPNGLRSFHEVSCKKGCMTHCRMSTSSIVVFKAPDTTELHDSRAACDLNGTQSGVLCDASSAGTSPARVTGMGTCKRARHCQRGIDRRQ